MNLKDKKVLVIGLAVTGVPLVKVLAELGANIIVNDMKEEENLTETLEELRGLDIKYILGKHPDSTKELGELDLVVVSPGVPLDIPFINQLRKEDINIIGEIELAYQLASAKIVAITGTNGKTTTTALTGEIFKNAGENTYVVGNIGVAAISKALETGPKDFMIMEVSSFQLESTKSFHPRAAAILNLTPDHLNRHKTMESYLDTKFKIFDNQTSEDYAIINFDDNICREASLGLKAKKIYFSRRKELEEGVFISEGNIVIKLDNKTHEVMSAKEVRIPGNHNIENALAATALAFTMGIKTSVIADTLRSFNGVEHRIEYVNSIEDVRFINDSKATNPDAAIKALEAVEAPIILLAGGMDKGNDFTDFIQAFNGKVKEMIVYGETAEKLYTTAMDMKFLTVQRVTDLEEAVKEAFNIAVAGDSVLLSPACASWDMYKNFEERGKHFKNIVDNLRRS